MRLQGALVVLGTAGATMAFTVMLLAPRGVSAVDAVERIKPMIARPQLASQGCVFVLKTDKPAYDAGDRPTIEITASNPTAKAADASVWINIASSAPTSAMSRMLPVPRSLWSHQCAVSLEPGQTKTVSVVSEAKLPAGQNILITMGDKDAAVLAGALGARSQPARGAQQPPAARTAGPKP
jgi:hypothetical protein